LMAKTYRTALDNCGAARLIRVSKGGCTIEEGRHTASQTNSIFAVPRMLTRQAAKGKKVSVQQTPLVAAGHHREPVQNVESPLALLEDRNVRTHPLVVSCGRATRRQFGRSTDDLHTHADNGRANVGLVAEMLRLLGWPPVRCQRAGRTHMSRKSGTH
jgi:hypothetical protein